MDNILKVLYHHFYRMPENTPEKPTVNTDVAATQEEPLHIIFSADTQSPEPTSTPLLASKPTESSAPPPSDPKPGTIAVIDETRCMWIPGFGWIEDNGGGNVGTVAEDMYENGNKIGIMD